MSNGKYRIRIKYVNYGGYMKALLVLVVFILVNLTSYAQTAKQAPLNPEFVRYVEKMKSGLWKKSYKSGYPLGYIPSPSDYETKRPQGIT